MTTANSNHKLPIIIKRLDDPDRFVSSVIVIIVSFSWRASQEAYAGSFSFIDADREAKMAMPVAAMAPMKAAKIVFTAVRGKVAE